MIATKTCTKCKIVHAMDLFCMDRKKKDGLSCHCIDCRTGYDKAKRAANPSKYALLKKEWAEANPEKRNQISRDWAKNNQTKRRAARIKAAYGITSEDYSLRYLEQSGACSTCRVKAPQLHIDHDHSTGKVRGLLCNDCNSGLGFFKDRSDVLLSAVRYLEACHQ